MFLRHLSLKKSCQRYLNAERECWHLMLNFLSGTSFLAEWFLSGTWEDLFQHKPGQDVVKGLNFHHHFGKEHGVQYFLGQRLVTVSAFLQTSKCFVSHPKCLQKDKKTPTNLCPDISLAVLFAPVLRTFQNKSSSQLFFNRLRRKTQQICPFSLCLWLCER